MEGQGHPSNSDMYEVVPTPGEAVALLPGDEVWLRYDLVDWGTWVVGYQVGKIERRIEEDGRFRLDSYQYDDENHRITLYCTVLARPTTHPDIQTAGMFGWGVVAGLIMAGSWALVYKASEVVTVWRINRRLKSVLDDPSFPQAAKDEIQRQLDGMDSGGSVAGAVGEFGAGLGMLALAILAYVFLVKK